MVVRVVRFFFFPIDTKEVSFFNFKLKLLLILHKSTVNLLSEIINYWHCAWSYSGVLATTSNV